MAKSKNGTYLTIAFIIIAIASWILTPDQDKEQIENQQSKEQMKQGIANNQRITDYKQARKLAHKLYKDLKVSHTFYCGCSFRGRETDLESCHYQVQKDPLRASHMEWEHIVPISVIGRHFQAWRYGDSKLCISKNGYKFKGRSCARKASPKFNRIEADLHNIMPSIGEVNAERANYKMGIIKGESRHFGPCDLEIRNSTIEPRPEIRGDIARIYLYMNAAYPEYNIINQDNQALFKKWHEHDPIDQGERTRNRLIYKVQGNYNPFIEKL